MNKKLNLAWRISPNVHDYSKNNHFIMARRFNSFYTCYYKQTKNISQNSFNMKNKTNYIIFSNKKEKQDYELSLNDVKIKKVNSKIFLGVYIDLKLTWKEHSLEGNLSITYGDRSR